MGQSGVPERWSFSRSRCASAPAGTAPAGTARRRSPSAGTRRSVTAGGCLRWRCSSHRAPRLPGCRRPAAVGQGDQAGQLAACGACRRGYAVCKRTRAWDGRGVCLVPDTDARPRRDQRVVIPDHPVHQVLGMAVAAADLEDSPDPFGALGRVTVDYQVITTLCVHLPSPFPPRP